MSQPTPTSPGHALATSAAPHPVPGDHAMEDNQVAIPGNSAVESESVLDDATGSGNEVAVIPSVPDALPAIIADENCQPAQLALHDYLQREPHLSLDGSMLSLEVATGWLQVNPVSPLLISQLRIIHLMFSVIVDPPPEARPARRTYQSPVKPHHGSPTPRRRPRLRIRTASPHLGGAKGS
jgi:hypothetical protein